MTAKFVYKDWHIWIDRMVELFPDWEFWVYEPEKFHLTTIQVDGEIVAEYDHNAHVGWMNMGVTEV